MKITMILIKAKGTPPESLLGSLLDRATQNLGELVWVLSSMVVSQFSNERETLGNQGSVTLREPTYRTCLQYIALEQHEVSRFRSIEYNMKRNKASQTLWPCQQIRCCTSTYCVHTLNTKKICSNLKSLNTFTKEIGSPNVKPVLIR